VPHCYLLAICSGSSVDRHSNNATLFNLVEQINLRPDSPPPAGTLIPVEVHAYFVCAPHEIGFDFELRFALVSEDSGLESLSDVFSHKSPTARYRTRTLGLPLPPIVGNYTLCLDWRPKGAESFRRESLTWPLTIVEQSRPRSQLTH